MTPAGKRVAIVVLAVAGAFSAILIGFVVLNWAPDRPVATLEARWAQPPSRFIDIAGMRVHVRDEGVSDDPVPIVLLHGTSASLHTWDGWVAALAGERRVVRFDLPGFGLTGPAPDGDYRVERYVAFVTAMLDALGIEQCVLAGNSFGGGVAWEVALALPPGRVQKLVLVDASGYPLDSQSVPLAFRIARVPLLSSIMKVTLPRSVVETSVRNVYGEPDRVTSGLVDRYYEIALRAGNRTALAQRFAQARYGDHANRIGEISVPTLILWGGRDRLIPPEHGEAFHRDIAGSRLVVFPDLGHVPHEEDAAATVAAVLEFL
jgi:pimeloyl-ACP methyl ester carboxylesterase